MGKELVRWFFFSVAVGMIPVVLNGGLALVVSEPVDISLLWDPSVLFGRGELLALSLGFSATIVGDAVAAEGRSGIFKTTLASASFVVGLATVGLYGIVLALGDGGKNVLGDGVAVVSLIPYIVMVLLSSVHIVTARR